jgi:Rab5 GDP/GTP exchange factor
MRECEPWRHSSDAEFENSTEAMEKLVMNRLYELFVLSQLYRPFCVKRVLTLLLSTFTPLVAKTSHPVTTDDLERDNILSQRIKLFRWVEEKHLDVHTGHTGFINFASQGQSALTLVPSAELRDFHR